MVFLLRTGRWKDAVTANIRAYEADMEFTKHCMVAYGPEHNTDMLIYAANMAGMVCHSVLPKRYHIMRSSEQILCACAH